MGAIATSALLAGVVAVTFAWRPVEGLLAFAMSLLLVETVEYWSGVDLRYLDEIAIPLLLAMAVTVHRHRLRPPQPGVREIGLALLLLGGIASSVANDVPSQIWLPALWLLAKGFAVFYLVISLPMTDDELGRILGVLLAVGLLVVGIGLFQFVAPDVAERVFFLPPPALERGTVGVVNSLFTHPAIYGWLAAVLSLFLVARFIERHEPWAIAVAVVAGVASVLSGRRTPILGMAVGIAVGLLRVATSGGASRRVVAMAILAPILIVVVSVPLFGDFYVSTLASYGARPEVIGEALGNDPDPEVLSELQPRVALAVGSVAIARDELPLGAGLGRFGSHMSREVYSPLYEQYGLHGIYGLSAAFPIAVTDNYWPMILGETGVLGLTGALLFFGAVAVGLWRAGDAAATPTRRLVTLGCLMVFAEALTRSLTAAVFAAPPIAPIVMAAAALALSGSPEPIAVERADERATPRGAHEGAAR